MSPVLKFPSFFLSFFFKYHLDLLLQVSCFFSSYFLISTWLKTPLTKPVTEVWWGSLFSSLLSHYNPVGLTQTPTESVCLCAVQKTFWKTRRIFCSSPDTWSCWVTERRTVTSPSAWRSRGWRTGDSTRSHTCSSGASETLFTCVF